MVMPRGIFLAHQTWCRYLPGTGNMVQGIFLTQGTWHLPGVAQGVLIWCLQEC